MRLAAIYLIQLGSMGRSLDFICAIKGQSVNVSYAFDSMWRHTANADFVLSEYSNGYELYTDIFCNEW